jgi:hypothetical protein
MQDINKKLCLCVKSGEVLLIKVKYCGIYRSDFKMKEVKKKLILDYLHLLKKL